MSRRTPEELEQKIKEWKALNQPITPRQARRALLSMGLLDQVNTVLNSLPEPDKSIALTDWEYGTEVRRNDPWVLALAPSLGLTEEQLDDLFVTAAEI